MDLNHQQQIRKKYQSFLFNLNQDLELDNFLESDLNLSIERTNNDTYLKLFEPHITKSTARPDDFNTLKSEFKMTLNHDNYNFNTGIISYEELQTAKSSDKYQYVLPYYNFNKTFNDQFLKGTMSFSSSGNNNLNNTNQLKSNIINNLVYDGQTYISNLGML